MLPLSYQKTMVDRLADASAEHLMVMLYDGMISKVKQAQERFKSGQVAGAKESVMRAMKIADALMENLNMEEGGDVAKNLELLYHYIIAELSSANRLSEPSDHLNNALSVLDTLQNSWKRLEDKVR